MNKTKKTEKRLKMPKHQMSKKMRLMIWLGAFSIAFLVGCSGLPARPSGELCTIDVAMQKCYCSGFGAFISVQQLREPELHALINAEAIEHPIEYCHKHVSFSPKSWESIQNYIDELRAYIDQRCEGFL